MMAFEVERTKNLALLEKTLGVPQKSEVFCTDRLENRPYLHRIWVTS